MKITVKQGETEISIDESDNPKSDNQKRHASIKWDDEKKRVLEVLSEMVNHVKELIK